MSDLTQGAILRIEHLETTMRWVTYDDKTLVLWKRLKPKNLTKAESKLWDILYKDDNT